MITAVEARRIAMSLPEAEEKGHMGHPDFRVRNRIFATLWPQEHRAVVKLSLADQSALVVIDPRAYSLNSWSHQGWTNVHLAQVSEAQFRDIVTTAWRNVAPKTLVAAHAGK